MRTMRGRPETLRRSVSEVYGVSGSSKGLQTASAKEHDEAAESKPTFAGYHWSGQKSAG